MLKSYDPNAAKEYAETESLYFEECGQHYDQGRVHADHNGPANLGRLYYYYNMRLKNLLYRQFSEAVDMRSYDAIQKVLPPAANGHLSGIRNMMIAEVTRTAGGFLPNMPKSHDPFSLSRFEIKARQVDLKIGRLQSTSALAVIATNPDMAAVCFTHRPGFTGISPTNAAEELVKHAGETFMSDYKPEQLRFFTHVPPEEGNNREHLFELHVSTDRAFRPVSHKPQFFDFALFNTLASPEALEAEVKNISDSEEKIDWHYLRALKERHSAQVHRRYLIDL